MFINSIPSGSIASSVWSNATRALTVSPDAVPAQDAVTNAYVYDVVGNKTDTPPATSTASNGTLSLIGYIKSLWDLLRTALTTFALQSTTQQTGQDNQSTGSTVYQLVASSAAAIRGIRFTGTVTSPSTTETIAIHILTGPGGSEVTRAIGQLVVASALASESFHVAVQVNLPAATRVAWKYTASTGTQSVGLGYTVEEA